MAVKIDKKDALKIGFGVGAVAVMYLIFSPGPSEGSENTEPENTQASLIVPLPEDPEDKALKEKDKTELYKENYDKRNQKDRVVSDDAFFSADYEVVDTITTTDAQDEKELEQFLSGQVPIVEEEIKTSEKETAKVKVIYKEAEPVKEPEKTYSRKRVGFTSNDASTGTKEIAATSDISLPVVVQRDQTVKSGSDVLLRTTEEISINGRLLEKNTYLNGRVRSISDNRMIINVSNVKGLQMTVHDLYGTKGVAIEGGVTKEIKGDALGDVVDNATDRIEIPILKDLNINRAAGKKMNDPEIKIEKGHKLILKPSE